MHLSVRSISTPYTLRAASTVTFFRKYILKYSLRVTLRRRPVSSATSYAYREHLALAYSACKLVGKESMPRKV